mmetsp:Transcript_10438/g.8974  ORF Transcript_10438/g.8974 Transcript_10438/m.8974 type:complete len:289 (+) Transcript_10438:148-1014(+)
MDNHKVAIKDFDAAIAIDPSEANVYFFRGNSKVSIEEYDSAIEDYYEAINLGAQDAAIYSWMGLAYQKNENQEKAAYYMDLAIQKDNKQELFYIRRSDLFYEMGNFAASIADLSQAQELDPSDPVILYKRGLSHYASKKYKHAIRDFKNSLQNNPHESYEPDLHYHIGISFANLENFENAIEPLSKGIRLRPYEAVYLHERAKAYLLTGKFEMALKDYDEVIKYQPKNPHAYFGRAFTYKALKEYYKSADDFDKAKSFDPQNPQLVVNSKMIYDIRFIKLCNPGEEMK